MLAQVANFADKAGFKVASWLTTSWFKLGGLRMSHTIETLPPTEHVMV
jgi:hypothetical protein